MSKCLTQIEWKGVFLAFNCAPFIYYYNIVNFGNKIGKMKHFYGFIIWTLMHLIIIIKNIVFNLIW